MASRKIEDCHPTLQPILTQFLALTKAAGLDILVTCTWRSPEEQTALYNQGRTTNGAIVTNAKAGQSRHNDMLNGKPASTAFDIVPLENGKPVWINTHPAWTKAGAIGKSLGLEWAGDWPKFREYPHFQLSK